MRKRSKGVESMVEEHVKKPVVSCEKYDEEERKKLVEEEKTEVEAAKVEPEEAKVEPIHPSEHERGGKKKGLLDTCK